jgi:hypothetical protein
MEQSRLIDVCCAPKIEIPNLENVKELGFSVFFYPHN